MAFRPTITYKDLRDRYPESGLRRWTMRDDGSRIVWESHPFEPTHQVKLRPQGSRSIVQIDYIWVEEGTPMCWGYLPQSLMRPTEELRPSYVYDGRRWQSLWSTHIVEVEPIIFSRRNLPRRTSEGYVYFIQAGDGGPIKIGWSCDVSRRLLELQTANAARLVLLAYVPGGQANEREWHARFSESRLEAEWFSPTPRLLSEIERIKG